MSIKRAAAFALALGASQAGAADSPLSAIDWLSESVEEIQNLPVPEITPEAGVTTIEVTALDEISKDSVGLLPVSVTGLPRDFWGTSDAATIAGLIAAQKTDALPEVLSLLYTVLLAEIDAPEGAPPGSTLLLARVDKLLDLGALQQAQSLLERAGPTEAAIFRRWFDVSLLTGHEDYACTAMRASPGFAPTMPARIFCLARNGDWNAAALTLATGETLGYIDREDGDLLARFLDPDMFEGEADLPPPNPLTPLDFLMREAIAQPRPSGALPLAFVNADLRREAGWRNQLIAAERLVRSRALNANTLIDLYTEKKPAASGGIWNRVAAIQALDVALLAGDAATLERALPEAYAVMQEVALEVPFARHFAERVSMVSLTGAARDAGFRIALLSDLYEVASNRYTPKDSHEAFLLALSRGEVKSDAVTTALEEAVAEAFSGVPEGENPLQTHLDDGRLGEAILRAMLLLTDEAFADPGDIRTALATLRAVGLEDSARRIALQLLILERRG
jgi:hypothetical protein